MFFYIHIPFCRQKCQYCHFALTPKFNELKVRIYIDALKKEIEMFFVENPGNTIETIYFGGGTPSILTGEQLAEILDIFRKHKIPPAPLSQGGKVEITLESNPEDITSEYLSTLAKI